MSPLEKPFHHVLDFTCSAEAAKPFIPNSYETTLPHKGYGKIILFGEHFVLYDTPAIVAAVDAYTKCEIKVLSVQGGATRTMADHQHSAIFLDINDERPAVPGYKEEKAKEQCQAHALVLKHIFGEAETPETKIGAQTVSVFWRSNAVEGFTDSQRAGISYTNSIHLQVRLTGDLVPTSGIGASAADCVSFSRALNELYSLHLEEEAVNRAGYAGECGYHGKPSGIDNTASTYGGVILFARNHVIKAIEAKAVEYDLERDMHWKINDHSFGAQSMKLQTCGVNETILQLVVVCSGITASTKKVVTEVRSLQAKDPNAFATILADYTNLALRAVRAIQSGSAETIGMLMSQNHILLQRIGVSCTALDTIIQFAQPSPGVLGAKLSGTGQGGIVIVLCKSPQNQKVLHNAFSPQESLKESSQSIPKVKNVWKYTLHIDPDHQKGCPAAHNESKNL